MHVTATARQWVKAEPDLLEELSALQRRFAPGRVEMAASTRAILREVRDPDVLARVARLPVQVFERLERLDRIKQTDAVTVQVALAVALLFCAPVRIGNLASIDLDRHLVEVGVGKSRRQHLRFPAQEVKNTVPLEFPLWEETERLLARYLTRYRPLLVGKRTTALFPGRAGGSKHPVALANQIARLCERELGLRITPHKFRAIAGAIYLWHNPTGHEVVRIMLGHKDIKTTLNFYAPLESDRALMLYDGAFAALRAGMKEAAE